MPRITEDLVRKRSEHNEREIGTLEELTLHQEDLEKLEHLQYWCKDLKILLLHSNLISRIENIGKLKKLEYINFSLNNIEVIENLEGCESLQKLDFTLNFIGKLTSIETLKKNIFLNTLYLTGNPCTSYKGYREFVVATLPSLKDFDGKEVFISERIKAVQKYEKIRKLIIEQETEYLANREAQKAKKAERAGKPGLHEKLTEQELEKFWKEDSENCPEDRIEIALRSRQAKEVETVERFEKQNKRVVKLFDKNGKPMNVNEAKVPFKMSEDDNDNTIVLDVAVFKHLDTNLIEADVQPNYVTVNIKNKLFQLVLMEEVYPDKSTAQRSQSSGHLIITMPKVNDTLWKLRKSKSQKNPPDEPKKEAKQTGTTYGGVLEFKEDTRPEYTKITELKKEIMKPTTFLDDDEVPPLE